jgi:hypothetical protein
MVHGAMVNVYPVGNFIVHGRIVDRLEAFLVLAIVDSFTHMKQTHVTLE